MKAIAPIRFGMVGAGSMAKTHSLALRNLPGLAWPEIPVLELRRVADSSKDAAEEAAKRWGWEEASTDWKSVTRADDVDAVIILTPNNSHSEIACDAFRHGKHVFCEKPLAHSLEAAQEMLMASKSSHRIGMVNFVYRNWPAIQLAKALVEEQKLGKLHYFEGHFFQDYAANPALEFSWRHSRAHAGGGAFGDIGSHIIDTACHLMGRIAKVSARSSLLIPSRPDRSGRSVPVDVDDLTVMMAEFSSGAIGSISAGWAMPGHKTNLSFHVVGSKGSAKFDWERSNELMFYDTRDDNGRSGFRRVVLAGDHPQAEIFWYAPGQGLGYGEAFVITLRRFVNAILSGKASTPSFEEAYHVSEVTDAAARAAIAESWVTIVPPSNMLAAAG